MTNVPANRLPEMVPAYRQLPARLLEQMSRHAFVTDINSGQNLFREGDCCRYHQILLTGKLRVQKVTMDGHEIVVGHVNPNEACNLSYSCLLGGEHYGAEAIAEEDSRVLMITRDHFYQLMEQLPGFREHVFREIKLSVNQLMDLVQEIAFDHMDHRLANTLLKQSKGLRLIKTTHQELAIELGTAREVVSRLLKEFEHQGWVKLYRGRIEILNPGQLNQI